MATQRRVDLEFTFHSGKGPVKAPRILSTGGPERDDPFVIGVLADLSGQAAEGLPPLQARAFRQIDIDNFEECLARIKPRLAFDVANTLTGEGHLSVETVFERMEDFSPDGVAAQVTELSRLLAVRPNLASILRNMSADGQPPDVIAEIVKGQATTDASAKEPPRPTTEEEDQGKSTLADLLGGDVKARPDPARDKARSAADAIARRALDSSRDQVIPQGVNETVASITAEIDRRLSAQVNAVIHHPAFQRLEAAWRGLRHLVNNVETDETVMIRVLDVSRNALLRDIDGSSADTSALFNKVHTQEAATVGGEPFACLVADLAFSPNAEDLSLLGRLADVAFAAGAPLLAGAAPELLGLCSWREMAGAGPLHGVAVPEADAWNAFRACDASSHAYLTAPRVLGRAPYGKKTEPVEAFDFEEAVGEGGVRCLWCNAAWTLAVSLAAAFERHGWSATGAAVSRGCAVEELPSYYDRETEEIVGPTEVPMPDTRAGELAQRGFTPLVSGRKTMDAFFAAMVPVHLAVR